DYNRCGVPLVEIVTEPDFRNAEEVNDFLYRLRSVFKYLGISDCKMEEGSMRADVNLSVRPEGSEEFGTRTEMKNINSFRAIERAIAYESARQIKVVENGGTIIQETRRWDNASGRSFAMRSKEEAKDYRYFPEPDLPAFHISDDEIKRCKDLIPEFAEERAERLVREMSLPEEDAVLITASRNLADLFEDTVKICGAPAEVRFWFTGGLLSFINETGRDPEDIALSPEKFAEFAGLVVSGELKREAGKKVFRALLESDGELDLRKFIKENGLETLDDGELIAETVRKVIAENPKPFEQYRNGETKVFGFFVGRVMKELKGRADPAAVNSTVRNILGNSLEKHL
ncbi:MAG: Asp-tRNA(Asn)/Glu-tRNA(Gln) amidotransferase subunit GatB, partial [Oscillospiraceae bacterium]|nr:Asp-tRNA(Asn)/Glu-tRNA(Gln) amidotransferase subunit GatB [Oscillospiraceae bacterium]